MQSPGQWLAYRTALRISLCKWYCLKRSGVVCAVIKWHQADEIKEDAMVRPRSIHCRDEKCTHNFTEKQGRKETDCETKARMRWCSVARWSENLSFDSNPAFACRTHNNLIAVVFYVSFYNDLSQVLRSPVSHVKYVEPSAGPLVSCGSAAPVGPVSFLTHRSVWGYKYLLSQVVHLALKVIYYGTS
jgi:hypothetical protein